MLILVFDTSTRNGTVGWAKLDGSGESVRVVDYAHLFMPSKPGHAERLLERIALCLDSGGYDIADVDLIVLAQGPGTFTGLRIGFSTAKAFALANDIPLVLVSTLEIIACNAKREGNVVALLDARRKEVYMGVFALTRGADSFSAVPIGAECVISPDEVEAVLQKHNIVSPVMFVGDGAIAYAEKLATLGEPASPSSIGLDSYTMAVRGYQKFIVEGSCNAATVEPVYLREPDAKKPKVPFGR